MKQLLYYLGLLIFIALLTGYTAAGQPDSMSMGQMVGVSTALVIYAVLSSLVGEQHTVDERETAHRYAASRIALIVGTAMLSVGILYQLFTHQVDYWLLAALIGINVSKIISLIYFNYRQ
jgi:hypothetical protein